MRLFLVQNRNNGRWDYCPAMLVRICQMADDGGHFETAEQAKAAALRDKTVPRPVSFEQMPMEGAQ